MSERRWTVECTDGLKDARRGGPPGSGRLVRPDGTGAAMFWRMTEAEQIAAALNAAEKRDAERKLLERAVNYIAGGLADWTEKQAILAEYAALNAKGGTE